MKTEKEVGEELEKRYIHIIYDMYVCISLIIRCMVCMYVCVCVWPPLWARKWSRFVDDTASVQVAICSIPRPRAPTDAIAQHLS